MADLFMIGTGAPPIEKLFISRRGGTLNRKIVCTGEGGGVATSNEDAI